MFYSKSVLVTGVGAPPGYNAVESLSSVDDLKIFAADRDEFAAGFMIPGVIPIRLPSASNNNKKDYLHKIEQICHNKNLNFILPCSEQEAFVLSHHKEILLESFNTVVITSNSDLIWLGMDKLSTVRFCEEIGLCVPKTQLVNNYTHDNDLNSFELEAGYPLIIKPRVGQGSTGLMVAHSTDELLGCLQLCRASGEDKLLQQFIPGGVDNVYTYGALFDRGKIIASTMHRKLATNSQVGGSATAGVLVNDQNFRQFAEEVFRTTGNWHGLVAIEAKRCAVTAKFFLMEINPRLWGFSALSRLAGLNFPHLAIELEKGKTINICDTDEQAGFRALRRFIDTPISHDFSCY